RTEAQAEVPARRRAPVAARRPATPAVAAPAAAPVHTERAASRTARVDRRAGQVVVGVIPVEAPLPDVAVHVVQPQPVRPVRADLAGALQVRPPGRAVGVVAVEVGLRGRERRGGPADVEGEEGGVRPSAAGILPLRLARLAVFTPMLRLLV